MRMVKPIDEDRVPGLGEYPSRGQDIGHVVVWYEGEAVGMTLLNPGGVG